MKVFDTFCFFNELDLLEIRLNILDQYVDTFVLCESPLTFSGNEKPLFYGENKERFSKWNDKIKHLVCPPIHFSDPFESAAYQKDSLRMDLSEIAHDEDIVYFGDLDEIWKPKEIQNDKVYNLKQLNYSYYLNNRSSESWIGTVVGKWGTFKDNTVNYWRANHDNVLEGGGWHFTNIGGYEQILRKLESYDHHLEANIPWVRDGLMERIKNNEDYLGRDKDWTGEPFKMWVEDIQLPEYIINNKEKYKHLWK